MPSPFLDQKQAANGSTSLPMRRNPPSEKIVAQSIAVALPPLEKDLPAEVGPEEALSR